MIEEGIGVGHGGKVSGHVTGLRVEEATAEQ